MSATASRAATAARPATPARTLSAGIAAFAIVELALAVFMAAAPHAFYNAIGAFGPFNDHYVRDVASFQGAIGIPLLLSLRWRSWRVPVLALTTIQFALHSLNHLIDVEKGHPAWTGYFDLLSLTAGTALLALLWREASHDAAARAAARDAEGGIG
jgi:hypothetical protein